MTEDSVIFTPEKSKKIALARLDLLNQWKEFRRKSDNKLQADYDFVSLYNTSNSHLFDILGKISRGTLHRWKNTLNGTEDYIHDETNCPIIFVGMGLAHKKLERYKHLYDRFSEIVKFETFSINDLKQIFDQLSEIPFTPDAIEFIHKKYNRFRQIVQGF